jgi:DNA ligase-1
MRYSTLAEAFEKLEKTSAYLEKNDIIADLLKKTPVEEMERVVLLLLGKTYPAYVSKETGVGLQQLKKAVALASGYSISEVDKMMKQVGDLGEVARQLLGKKKQVTLFAEPLTVKKVFENIKMLPDITGEGSVDRKVSAIAELLSSSTPLEAKYVTRTVLGDLRIGVAEGRLRDAIATAFAVSPDVVEHAYMLTTDYAIVAKAAAAGREKGLKELGLEVGHPVNPMLAQRAESLDEIMERMGGKAAFEIKLDGIRIQAHKDGDKVTLFTRRMEDYTNMFPDLVEPLRQALKPKRAIVDGELVAMDKRTNKPMPFQEVLKRRRKYEIKEAIEQIPVEIHLFDVLMTDGRSLLDEPYTRRRAELERIVKPMPGKVMVVEQIISDNPEEITAFMNKSLAMGHEGLLAKDLKANYRAGRREFVWLKLKPTLETLDLVVVGGLYGKGKRAGYFGSYILAARDEDDGRFKTVTKCGSGYTDEDLKELTKMFKKIQIEKPHEDVDIEIECDAYFQPKVVFEVLFEEVQISPELKHTGRYGLRFPRYVRIREDRRPEEINTVQEIAEIYEMQERKKAKVHGSG